jgi:hypothetical protein
VQPKPDLTPIPERPSERHMVVEKKPKTKNILEVVTCQPDSDDENMENPEDLLQKMYEND